MLFTFDQNHQLKKYVLYNLGPNFILLITNTLLVFYLNDSEMVINCPTAVLAHTLNLSSKWSLLITFLSANDIEMIFCPNMYIPIDLS